MSLTGSSRHSTEVATLFAGIWDNLNSQGYSSIRERYGNINFLIRAENPSFSMASGLKSRDRFGTLSTGKAHRPL